MRQRASLTLTQLHNTHKQLKREYKIIINKELSNYNLLFYIRVWKYKDNLIRIAQHGK